MLSKRQEAILMLLGQQKQASISQLKQNLQATVSTPTLNRDLAALVRTKHILKHGKGRGTTYALAPHHLLFYPIDEALYFAQPPDERQSYKTLRTDLFLELEEATLFTPSEETQLKTLQEDYKNSIAKLSPTLYQKELERLTIELSWKSAEIEGNTYSLLETELLFQDNTFAPHKSYKDARMLLNHKDVLAYMRKHTLKEISIPLIEDLHRILVKDLGIKKKYAYARCGHHRHNV